MTQLPPPATDAKFVREAGFIKSQSAKLKHQVTQALNSNIQLPEFLTMLTSVTCRPHVAHSSESHYQFYNQLFCALNDSLQKADFFEVTIGAMMNYIDEIKFGGFAPKFATRPVLNQAELTDVEPIFEVWCQDDEKLPVSSLAFRFTVDEDGGIHPAIVNSSWLSSDKNHEKVVTREPKPEVAKAKQSSSRKRAKAQK